MLSTVTTWLAEPANHVPLEYDPPAWFEPGAGQVKDLADDQGQVGQLRFGQRRPPG